MKRFVIDSYAMMAYFEDGAGADIVPAILNRRCIKTCKNYYNPNCAIVELTADSRQMSSRYSGLCAAISNAEDVVRSANPTGFTY